MTDDYTPTTEEVCEGYRWGAGVMTVVKANSAERRAQFDSWLAEHDAALIESLADGVDLPGSTATGYYGSEQVAGYRDAERDIEAWLRERARQVREGEA